MADQVAADRRRTLQIAAATLGLAAVLGASFVLARPLRRGAIPATRLAGSTATPTPFVSVSTSATPTPKPTSNPKPTPTPTPTATPTPPKVAAVPASTKRLPESAYADAIAVVRPNGDLVLLSADGTAAARIATFGAGEFAGVAWTPDRREVYVSELVSMSTSDGCRVYKAVAVNVRTKARRALGEWRDFAFSSDGDRLAVVEYRDCGKQAVLVRDLATGQEQRIPQPRNDEADFYDRLVWVPNANRIVLQASGPGESQLTMLLDIETADSLDDGTPLDLGAEREKVEWVDGYTYVGGRLIATLSCCHWETRGLTFVERNAATGDVRDLLTMPQRNALDLATSPDGKRVGYRSFLPGAETTAWTPDGLRVWDLAREPTKIADNVAAFDW